MSDNTQVYLITGFLGAGKTTFLNRIIDRFPRTRRLTLLVNEFGEIGVDGTLVESEDIDMMEISKGSIFCVCVKTDFIKGLYQLHTTIKPDVLLIESTGVANPSDLKMDLKLPIFNNRFHFMEQFCIIDAPHFLDAYEVYASLEKQIASSSVFILNKIDQASPEKVAAIKTLVHKCHPDPRFFETTYADIPLETFFDFSAEDQANAQASTAGEPVTPLSPEEMETFLDALFDSPDLQMTPPDLLMSVTYKWTGQNIDQIRTMAAALPKTVIRAKGFIEEKGKTLLFSYVMGDWSIEECHVPAERVKHKNIIVFIGPPGFMDAIEPAIDAACWTHLGVYQPLKEA